MRRLFVSLTALLCLALPACAEQTEHTRPEAPAEPATDAPRPAEQPAEPLKLGALNVEFVAEGRDADGLLKLQADFPWALSDALEKQNVEIGSVVVTFGTSGEATQTAMRGGDVQLAFLSAEGYFPHRVGMVIAVERAEEPDLSLGLIVAAASDDADADERFAAALRAALPDLAPTLASYAGEAANGVYTFDAKLLERLNRLYEDSAAGMHQ